MTKEEHISKLMADTESACNLRWEEIKHIFPLRKRIAVADYFMAAHREYQDLLEDDFTSENQAISILKKGQAILRKAGVLIPT
jgi:hypothetical protein